MSTLFLYLEDSRKNRRVLSFHGNTELVRAAAVLALVDERKRSSGSINCALPSDLGLGPPCHGAVEANSLALPHCLSAGLDDKLWGVCQAVWVHFPAELHPLVHLGRGQRPIQKSDPEIRPDSAEKGESLPSCSAPPSLPIPAYVSSWSSSPP